VDGKKLFLSPVQPKMEMVLRGRESDRERDDRSGRTAKDNHDDDDDKYVSFSSIYSKAFSSSP
jgi:hypothetical protein